MSEGVPLVEEAITMAFVGGLALGALIFFAGMALGATLDDELRKRGVIPRE